MLRGLLIYIETNFTPSDTVRNALTYVSALVAGAAGGLVLSPVIPRPSGEVGGSLNDIIPSNLAALNAWRNDASSLLFHSTTSNTFPQVECRPSLVEGLWGVHGRFFFSYFSFWKGGFLSFFEHCRSY